MPGMLVPTLVMGVLAAGLLAETISRGLRLHP